MLPRYDTLGRGYARWRRPDPRIADAILAALGEGTSVVNVGAGTKSYEPPDRRVVAVEPSPVMIGQRPSGAAPVVRATAEALPFATGSFDASLAVLTLHHWGDWRRGVSELARVARGRVVVLTHDMSAEVLDRFWLLRDYLPSLAEHARRGFPPLEELRALLDGRVETIAVPADCTDGFLAAYWRRPATYLDASARAAISYFHDAPAADVADGLRRLQTDLASGAWARRHQDLLKLDSLDLGYRLIVAELE